MSGFTYSAFYCVLAVKSVQHAGNGVGLGRDHTLYALATGLVKFMNRGALKRKFVAIVPATVTE